jgi:hypothetical protein
MQETTAAKVLVAVAAVVVAVVEMDLMALVQVVVRGL